ncbi:MAG: aspartate ammonia-lyase [Bacteroidales bacterium]|nr:aspartate ammonia-lyase [Bacteroidales bacterium]MBQ3843739.1 aspartate ammonia-lyase [Bacteroidales bacterium]
METEKFRIESDLLGSKEVPADALYGVQTVRAIENFDISGHLMSEYPNFIKGMAITKKAAAIANYEVGMIDIQQRDAICTACDELLEGKHHDQFPIDMIQGGAGTSTNMCANEVIANRALELMGHKRGDYKYCSPNDIVNASQSTNDAYPCSIHLAMVLEHEEFLLHLVNMIGALDKKAEEFKDVIKMGRTQLQDAVPMTLGQTFSGFAASLRGELKTLNMAAREFLVVNMGATAIGTGICSKPGYSGAVINALRRVTGWNITLADNLIEATSATSCMIQYSAAMKRLCIKINKMCNDLRLMSSGPRCGFNEINLPQRQPGSSIMPGKVNPVIPEVMNQVCYKVIGNDMTIALASDNGQLELNVMEPVIAYCLFESIHLLTNGLDTLRTHCIEGIEANVEHCRKMVENSIGIVTMLNPIIGYKESTKIAKEASETGRGVYELVLEHGILTKEQLDWILRPENMIKPVEIKF